MTDLHTHILPGVDDGSPDVATSLAMLAQERAQGVDTVCLTPHFDPAKEDIQTFLARRRQAFALLQSQLPEDSPRLILGAEVAWFPTLCSYEGLEQLSLDGESFLLELPFRKWDSRLLKQLDRLPEQTGLIPILAHVERYIHMQDSATMHALFSLGLPLQMNASSVLEHPWQSRRLLRRGAWYIGSDCHNLAHRPPNMADAARHLEKKLGPQAIRLLSWQPQ